MEINEGNREKLRLRWQDLDHQGHVYHATYLTLLDEVRTRWLGSALGVDQPDSYVIARVEIDYTSELSMEEPDISVAIQVGRVGNKSIRTVERIYSANNTEAARAEVVLVLWDRELQKARPLTDLERERAESYLISQ